MSFSCDFIHRLDYPLLLGLNELMNFMFGNFYRCDDFDFAGRHDDARLRGPLTAPDLIREWQVRNDGSLCDWGKK